MTVAMSMPFIAIADQVDIPDTLSEYMPGSSQRERLTIPSRCSSTRPGHARGRLWNGTGKSEPRRLPEDSHKERQRWH